MRFGWCSALRVRLRRNAMLVTSTRCVSSERLSWVSESFEEAA